MIKNHDIPSHLYIPHGSDERSLAVEEFIQISTLYPTWFRWKLFRDLLQLDVNDTLYPTWFRWKLLLHPQAFGTLQALYPTWFRWKVRYVFSVNIINILYIPHGSDESQFCPTSRAKPFGFISHMVQMKVRLDETTIRTKSRLYIPHGSDERYFACFC